MTIRALIILISLFLSQDFTAQIEAEIDDLELAAILGTNFHSSGVGVAGQSLTGTGVLGFTDGGTGVYGTGHIGVQAEGYGTGIFASVVAGKSAIFEGGPVDLNHDQAVLNLNSSDATNGSVIVLDNDGEAPYTYIGALNFQRKGMTPGQIGYLGNQTMAFRVDNVDALLKLSAIGNHLEMSNGAHCTAGGQWMDNSSRTLKHVRSEIVGQNILDKLSQLAIYDWSYKVEPESKHMGPTAEEFYALFGLGSSNKHVSSTDLAAIALAGIKQLHEENTALKKELVEIKELVHALK